MGLLLLLLLHLAGKLSHLWRPHEGRGYERLLLHLWCVLGLLVGLGLGKGSPARGVAQWTALRRSR